MPASALRHKLSKPIYERECDEGLFRTRRENRPRSFGPSFIDFEGDGNAKKGAA